MKAPLRAALLGLLGTACTIPTIERANFTPPSPDPANCLMSGCKREGEVCSFEDAGPLLHGKYICKEKEEER